MICDSMGNFPGDMCGEEAGSYTRRETGEIGASDDGDNDDRNYGG